MTTWWQRGAIYQIYPRSFADADGDGVGDLRGIDAAARPPVGARGRGGLAVADLPLPHGRLRLRRRRLLRRRPAVRHAGGLRRADSPRATRAGSAIILDWVPNHTSDRHPWFEASRSSREDPKRDWYVWRDGAPDGGPPNDWESVFKAVGPGVDLRRGDRPVVPALVPRRAARPQLGQPGGRGGDARRAALLVRPRRRRAPARRDLADRQGPAAARPDGRAAGRTTRTGTRSTSGCAGSAAWSTSTRTA